MATSRKVHVFTILAVFVILVKAGSGQVTGHKGTQGIEDDESSQGSGEIKPVGRYYSLSTCEYRMQPGYTCLSCSRALHCYISNTAILVDCRGLFPYCRDGHCSMYRGTTCDSVAHNQNSPLTAINSTTYHSVQGVKENVTALNSVPIDSATQMIATEIQPVIPDHGIASQGKGETVPVGNSLESNKPISDNFVNTR